MDCSEADYAGLHTMPAVYPFSSMAIWYRVCKDLINPEKNIQEKFEFSSAADAQFDRLTHSLKGLLSCWFPDNQLHHPSLKFFISSFQTWCQFPRQPKYLCFSTHAHEPLVYNPL